jgi:hypothetical protein
LFRTYYTDKDISNIQPKEIQAMTTQATEINITNSRKDKNRIIAEHIDALRSYASRAITNEAPLTDDEEADKENRFRELVEIGKSINLGESDMVGILFKDLLVKRESKCGCPTCRARFENQPE